MNVFEPINIIRRLSSGAKDYGSFGMTAFSGELLPIASGAGGVSFGSNGNPGTM